MIITFTIPDAQATRVINGIAENENYQASIFDANRNKIPNPETKQQFAKRILIEMIKIMVRNGEKKEAEKNLITDTTEVTIT